jgi:hypothetical protein
LVIGGDPKDSRILMFWLITLHSRNRSWGMAETVMALPIYGR